MEPNLKKKLQKNMKCGCSVKWKQLTLYKIGALKERQKLNTQEHTVQWFKKEYPELVIDGQIKYDELEWSQFKRYLGTRKVKKRKKFRSNTHDNFQLAGESTMQKYVAAERFYAGKQMPSFSFSSSFENNLTKFMTGHHKNNRGATSISKKNGRR